MASLLPHKVGVEGVVIVGMVRMGLLRAVERLDRFLVFSRLFFQCLAYRLRPPQLPVLRADEGSPSQRDNTDNRGDDLDEREHYLTAARRLPRPTPVAIVVIVPTRSASPTM